MKVIWSGLYVVFLQALYISSVLASPTSSDFLPCHKMASSVLLICLDKKSGYVNNDCFNEAKQAKNVCYKEIAEKYQVDDKRLSMQRALGKKK
jgi:hypothetical protein